MAESATQQSPAPPAQVYTVAVLVSLFSLLLVLVIIPPLFWHFRNRNVGATSLVAWIIIALFFTSINGMIWPSDDMAIWFSGIGLCDIEVRFQEASQVALPASSAAVLRGLAAVLDTDHASVMQTKAQKRRNTVIDLLFCVCAPLLQIVFYELVHFRRYAIVGIAGCTPAISDNWFSFLLLSITPLFWTLVDVVYAGKSSHLPTLQRPVKPLLTPAPTALILIRLYRYRLNFSTILATNQTTKSRFLRLYLICCLWIIVFLPIMLCLLVERAPDARLPFSWSETHNRAAYSEVLLVPSNGNVLFDRWIWLGTGFCIFLFFGCGREAMSTYRKGLLAVGLGRVFPSFRREPTRRATVSTISSFSSKAKMLFKRKSSGSDATTTWKSTTSASRTHSNADEPVSPKTATFLEAIREINPERNLEKAGPAQTKPSVFSHFPAFFSNAAFSPRKRSSAPVPLAELANETATVRSEVSTGERPLSLVRHVRDASSDVVVRKEIRQDSEHEGV